LIHGRRRGTLSHLDYYNSSRHPCDISVPNRVHHGRYKVLWGPLTYWSSDTSSGLERLDHSLEHNIGFPGTICQCWAIEEDKLVYLVVGPTILCRPLSLTTSLRRHVGFEACTYEMFDNLKFTRNNGLKVKERMTPKRKKLWLFQENEQQKWKDPIPWDWKSMLWS
jgi:hypothetical protein